MKWFVLALRLIVGGIFVYAGAVKIYDPAQFAHDVANYRLLPHEFINLFAITLPWVEVIPGLLLMSGGWVRASALILTVLCAVFLIAIAQAVARGLDIRCGCFGTVEARRVGLTSLVFDGVLLVVAVWLTVSSRARNVPPQNPS